ncbi:MAG: hypothetical protein UR42_C0008G0020 [Candidatus Roizmanbacteria bacterium GW2011_GWA2_33_33]|uniref:YcfA family protein n=2 Tax=Candidatus Roizmaniibacteriota TaxID=1752723 RepID=A0A0G0AXT3_9BACT|nr:MAG: hypothetical protein UR42_C0008G0020 [Candidatus Roizmanbacteria bacterium GW2011_GWA2_33_33]KKP62028.1 MAG: hypothetical protein UR56_C0007G0011 [Candidatus Roizmanbacteria bacterium GW2011_GWC2_34_23]
MVKLPSFKPRDLEKILLKNGFMIKRQTGSHRVYHNFKSEKTTVVPFHSKDIPQGTLRSIIKQTGLNENIFLKK